MRDRIELGKRQVQQSQWGSKDALNEDMSMKAKLASMARRIEEFELRNVHQAQPQAMQTSFEECPTIPTVRDMCGYQSSYTSSWNNHPNLTTQPQLQPSMSTSSLEQAILKISKVMEDFVEAHQSRHSKGKGSFLLNPTITFKEPMQKSRKVLKIDTLVGIAMTTLWTNLSLKIIRFKMIKGYPNPLKHPLLQEEKRNEFPWTKWEGCQFFGILLKCSCRYDACKIEMEVKQRKQGAKMHKQSSHGISHHEHTRRIFLTGCACCEKEFLYILESQASRMLS
ncbi:hypothetical protein AAG906_011603 [Vitis piasezkii]